MFDHLTVLTRLAIGLALVVLLPQAMVRLRLPGVLGFILAGILLGPGLTGVLDADSESIKLWSELGKLLFMFFMGFEIDLEQFSKARSKAAIFGAATFAFPFAITIALARFLDYEWVAATLIGSMVASHTLVAYPVLSKLKLVSRESDIVTVGGTLFTDVAAMIVLALTVSIYQTGFSWSFLAIELVELAIYVPLVLFGMSKLARKLIVHFGNSPEARVCILLALIAVAAELASFINLEGIVGAFLIGIAAKRALRGKFAVEQLEVLANALFIPCFFLTTGFLIDFPLLARTAAERPLLVAGLIVALAVGKFLAATVARRLFSYSATEGKLIFSLTLPQMAATLATAVVGYQTLNAAGERLIDAGLVNATLALVVVTCIIGPILSERWAKQLADGEPTGATGVPLV